MSSSRSFDRAPLDALRDGHDPGEASGAVDKLFFLARRGLRSLSRDGEPFLGYEAGDLLWRDMFELVHDEDLPALQARISSIIESPGTSSSIEVRLKDASEAWRWVEARVRNVLEGPGDAGLLVVDLHDLSGHRGPEQPVLAGYRDALEGLLAYPPSGSDGVARPTARTR